MGYFLVFQEFLGYPFLAATIGITSTCQVINDNNSVAEEEND